MSAEKRILEEIIRYRQINNYINEQELGTEPTPDLGAEPAPAGVEAPPVDTAATATTGEAEPIDVASDPDVEKVGDEVTTDATAEVGGETEELDITDLVTKQDDILSKQEEIMSNLTSQIGDLQNKLGEIDKIFQKVSDLEMKFEKYRQKTPEEKLQLRSLDSYPFNQKLTDFFDVKQDEMEASGKNDYVLTDDQISSYDPATIKGSFNVFDEELPLNGY